MERDLEDLPVPAAERAIAGLCHSLNGSISAIAAYVFLLERRGTIEGSEAPLAEHVDKLAGQVRLLRSLVRNDAADVEPVAASLLAESVTLIMSDFPEGPVVFQLRSDDAAAVVRCDWPRAVRALVSAGAWLSRDVPTPVRVSMSVASPGILELRRADAPDRTSALEGPRATTGDYPLEVVDSVSVRIRVGG